MNHQPETPDVANAAAKLGNGDDPLVRASWPMSDAGAALRFMSRHSEDLRYIVNRGWMVWDGARFIIAADDESPATIEMAKLLPEIVEEEVAAVARCILDGDAESGRKLRTAVKAWDPLAYSEHRRGRRSVDFHDQLRKFATRCGQLADMKSMLPALRAQPSMRVSASEVDAQRYVFNAANKRLDLHALAQATLENSPDAHALGIGPHRRADLATLRSGTIFDGRATCPEFGRFMMDVFPDESVRRFVQKLLGYCLTGSIQEQAIYVFHGTGSNGKSTLLSTLRHVLGEYFTDCQSETLLRNIHRNSGSPSPELVRLAGARAIAVSEFEHDAVLSDGRIKALTGGEPIVARELYGKLFEFEPQGKVLISVNRMPIVKSGDYGTLRRIVVIPFTVRFDGRKRDKFETLLSALKKEASGILNWLIEGWRMYQSEGLVPPSAIVEASRPRRGPTAMVERFIAEECLDEPDGFVTFKEFKSRFAAWCQRTQREAISDKMLGQSLGNLGYEKRKAGHGGHCVYQGLSLREN